ncbi:MAG TPA: ATP-binding protein [Solirubrobacteraceae bacterium]|jgi:anti-sigma regulatory factor (Ser/Thr protein kinase)|nr:ATP-binding protein [Solirubrobacteraceae bacterium]
MAAGSAYTLRHRHCPAESAEGALIEALPRPRGDVWEIPFAGEDLFELRQLVSSWATKEAMGDEANEELVLAVHEVATNSVRHGGGVGMLRLWRTADTLVCEIQDAGYISDPLRARRPPGNEASASRGLWIAGQICDLVEICSSPRGSQVRMHKRLAPA